MVDESAIVIRKNQIVERLRNDMSMLKGVMSTKQVIEAIGLSYIVIDRPALTAALTEIGKVSCLQDRTGRFKF